MGLGEGHQSRQEMGPRSGCQSCPQCWLTHIQRTWWTKKTSSATLTAPGSAMLFTGPSMTREEGGGVQ